MVFFPQAALTTTTYNLHQTINFNGPTDFLLLRISVTAFHGPVPVRELPAPCTRFFGSLRTNDSGFGCAPETGTVGSIVV